MQVRKSNGTKADSGRPPFTLYTRVLTDRDYHGRDLSWGNFKPLHVLEFGDTISGTTGFMAIDSSINGIALGCIRISSDVTAQRIVNMARLNSIKCGISGNPYGSGRVGIRIEGGLTHEHAMLLLATALKDYSGVTYVASRELGCSEADLLKYLGAVTGMATLPHFPVTSLPVNMRGLPPELGFIGYSTAVATKTALELAGKKVTGSKIAIEGFGKLSIHAVKHLVDMGAVIVAVSDSKGTIYNPEGLSLQLLFQAKFPALDGIEEMGIPGRMENIKAHSLFGYSGKKRVLDTADLFGLECDVLIPTIKRDAINSTNIDSLRTGILVEAGNLLISTETIRALEERGFLVIPGSISNAGGMIRAGDEFAYRFQGFTFEEILSRTLQDIEAVISSVCRELLTTARDAGGIVNAVKSKALDFLETHKDTDFPPEPVPQEEIARQIVESRQRPNR